MQADLYWVVNVLLCRVLYSVTDTHSGVIHKPVFLLLGRNQGLHSDRLFEMLMLKPNGSNWHIQTAST